MDFLTQFSGEVMGGRLDRFALRLPSLAGLRVWSDQAFSLCIDVDHGVAADQELLGESVDVPELGVTVETLLVFQYLAGSLQVVSERTQDLRHDGVADRVAHCGQFPGEVAR
jgi:hypothetical protein